MSNKKALRSVENKLTTLANSYGFAHYHTVIKTVDMLRDICEGKSISKFLTKDRIITHLPRIKEFLEANEHELHTKEIKTIIVAAKKAESLTLEYKELLEKIKADKQKTQPKTERETLSEMFEEETVGYEDAHNETIMIVADTPEEDIFKDDDLEEEEEEDAFVPKEKPKKKKKKKEQRVSPKKIFFSVVIGFVVVLVLFLAFFISSLLDELKEEGLQKNSSIDSVYPQSTPPPAYVSNTGMQEDTFGVKNNISSQFLDEVEDVAPMPHAPHADSDESKEVHGVDKTTPPQYPPIQMSQIQKMPGGVCQLVPKYSEKDEFVYYVKKDDMTYIPAFQDRAWDGKGLKVEKRTVGLSLDEKNGLVEVEDGKYLPIELFSSCLLFEEK